MHLRFMLNRTAHGCKPQKYLLNKTEHEINMATIKQLIRRGERIYPLTSPDAVVFTNGQNITDKLNYIYQNYEQYQDLIDNLDITYNASTATLDLSLGGTLLSSVSTGNLAVSGIITSAQYNDTTSELTLNFDSGDSAVINLQEVLGSILSDYKTEVSELKNLHVALSESQYETLRVKEENTYYYTYEDDEEVEP